MNLNQRVEARNIAIEAGYSQAEQDQPNYKPKEEIIGLATQRASQPLDIRGQTWTFNDDQSRDFIRHFQAGYEEQIRMHTLLTQLQVVAIKSMLGSERHGISRITLRGAESEESLHMRDANLGWRWLKANKSEVVSQWLSNHNVYQP